MTIFSYAIPFFSDLLSAYRCRCAFMPFQFNTLPSYNFGEYSSIFSDIPSFNFNLNSPQLYQPRILSFDFGNVWGNMGLNITPIKKSSETYDPSKSIRYPINYAKYGRNGEFIKKLNPVMQDKVMALLDYAKAEGINGVMITSGYRSYQDQLNLTIKYKNVKGRVAKPGTSAHEFGRAIDINASQLKPSDVYKLARYAKEVLHMRWGGDFGTYREIWHFDITAAQAQEGNLSISKPSQSKTTQNTAKITTQNTSKIFVNKNATPHVLTQDEYASAMNGNLTYPAIKIGGVTYYKVNSASGINKQAKNAFDRMKMAAAKDGINLKIVSGYRSHETQVNLFKKYYNGKGNKSITETAKFSAIPGYSEHESGCAFDINTASRSDHFERSEAYKWLVRNAKKYGFELSYPENNKEGLIFEPWHWRYVG